MAQNSFLSCMRTMRNVMVTFCLAVISGCFGGYRLLSIGPSGHVEGWHQYAKPRPPNGPIENLVVEVAKTLKAGETDDVDVWYLLTDETNGKPVQVVDVVEKTDNSDDYPERTVTRYRVAAGMIVAMSDPANEFYENIEFERAIFKSINMAKSVDRVMIYNDGTKAVSIISHLINMCTAEIKVYKSGVVGGKPVAEKTVVFCFMN